VFPNEQIKSGDNGVLAVEFSDGSRMDLGRNSDITLNENTQVSDEDNKQKSSTLEDAQGEVAEIQKALAEDENFDPSKLEAPAAGGVAAVGGGGEDDGSSVVEIDYLNPTTTPNNGFDTIGITVAFPEQREVLLLEPDIPVPVAGPTESVEVTDSAVDETSGLNTNASGALSIDGAAPQDVSLLASGATWDAANKALIADDNSYRIDVNNDGTYTFTLLSALDHPPGSGVDNKFDFDISAELTSDSGSVFNTSFTVTVYDDGPVVNNTEGSIRDIYDAPDEILEGLIDYDLGLDGLGSIRLNEPSWDGDDNPLSSEDDTLSFELDNSGNLGVLYAYVDVTSEDGSNGNPGWDGVGGADRLVFTLQPEASSGDVGSYELVLYDVVDLPEPSDGSEELQSLDILFGFTATDNDGDSVSDDFTVTFNNFLTDLDPNSTLLSHPDSVDLTA